MVVLNSGDRGEEPRVLCELNDLVQFVRNETGAQNVGPDDDLLYDLGVDGAEFVDLVEKYAKKYQVNICNYLWYFHHGEEGFNIVSLFIASPDRRVPTIPVTPRMLTEFANAGKWGIDYPEHSLPKRRYDLIIGSVIYGAFLLTLFFFVVIKYAILKMPII